MTQTARDVWVDVHRERSALIEDLVRLEPGQWEIASLCDGWAVRDVVAHLAATAVLSKRRFARAFVRAGFSPDRIVQQQIADARGRSPADLLVALQSSAKSTASPPLPTISRIIEIVVHGEDIRRPLGLRHTYSTTHIGAAVAYLACDRLSGARRRLAGVRLVGKDADFAVGAGLAVEGPALSVLLAACGRRAALSELSGPGVDLLARRM